PAATAACSAWPWSPSPSPLPPPWSRLSSAVRFGDAVVMIELDLHHEFADFRIDIGFVAQSRCVALFGDSGAGKSTVLDAIAGLLKPHGGRITLDGQVLFDRARGIDVAPARREIGYVFQDGRLFPHLSVRANLLYGARARRRPASELDRIVALLDLGNLLGRKVHNLSGGERQRVAI